MCRYRERDREREIERERERARERERESEVAGPCGLPLVFLYECEHDSSVYFQKHPPEEAERKSLVSTINTI